MSHGCGRELANLERVLEAVRAGSHQVAIIDGEAGIGKSALLAAAIRAARDRGFQTFAGAAEPEESDRPFATVTRTLGVRAEVDRLLATPRAGRWVDPMVDIGFRAVDAIIDVVRRRAARGPVLVAVDDLHWADRPSTTVLAAIHRKLAGLPIMLVVALRTGEGSAHCDELLGHLSGGCASLTLAPLDDESIATMAGELAGAPVGPRLRRQLANVGGNPFFAGELIRALADEGMLTVQAGVAESSTTDVPRRLVHIVLRRLRLLPERTLELLRLAAVLGQSFSVADLALVTGRPAVEVAAGLAPALRSHTLRDAGELLAFGHALTWDAVYHDIPSAVRKALHRQAAGALVEAGVPATRVARHLVLGAESGDAEAVDWLRGAAREVAAGSPATAAELLGSALTIAGDDRDSLTAELAPLLVVIGQPTAARELTDAALARGVDPVTEAKLRVGLTHVLMRCGRVSEAMAQASVLLELLPGEYRELAKGVVSYVYLAAGAADTAASLAADALLAGDRAAHDVVTATALMTLTWTNAAYGRVDDAIAAGQRAVRVTEGSRAAMSGFLFPHCPLGAALLQADRFAEAESAFRDGLARAERTAAPGTLVYHAAGLVAAGFLTGAWDTALREAETALELAATTGTSWLLLPCAVTSRILVARDELAPARAALDAAARAPEAGDTTMMSAWLHWARAVWLEACGATEHAAAVADRAWRAVPAMRDVIGNRIAPIDCTRIALSGGDPTLAKEIAAELARMAERNPVPSLRATATHCRGLVDGDAGALAEAVALLRHSGRGYQLAMACEDAASAWAAVDRDRGRELFREALAGYRELAASRDVARVSAAMRTWGFRPGGAARGSGGELTRAERKVAELVAEGLSNPQIAQRLYISRHTAETHLKRIFVKLNVSSRTQLAAIIAAEIPDLRDAGSPAGQAG